MLLTQRLFFPSCRLIRCSRPHRTLLRCRSACFRAVDVVNEKTVTESSPFGNFLFTINRASPAAHNPLVLLCSRCHSVAHTAPCRGLVVLQVAGCRVSAGVFLAPPPPTPPPPQRRDRCFLFLSGADPLSAPPTPRPYPLPHQWEECRGWLCGGMFSGSRMGGLGRGFGGVGGGGVNLDTDPCLPAPFSPLPYPCTPPPPARCVQRLSDLQHSRESAYSGCSWLARLLCQSPAIICCQADIPAVPSASHHRRRSLPAPGFTARARPSCQETLAELQ